LATVTRSQVPCDADGGEADSAIIERSRSEPEAFAAVFDRYSREIYRYAARRLGRGLADDVAAETFLVAFDRRDRYDLARPNARPWLYGIASNLIAGHRRAEVQLYRALARTGMQEAAENHADRVAGRVDSEAVRERLAAALAAIPGRERDVLLLVAWADLSTQESSQALGIPEGTVRSRLHRARRRLRAALADINPPILREDTERWTS
jgi:RNA polymerase sigma factor (sigma-70 family)